MLKNPRKKVDTRNLPKHYMETRVTVNIEINIKVDGNP